MCDDVYTFQFSITTKRAGCYVYVTSHGHLSNQTEVQTAISGVIICYIPLPKTHIKVHIQDPNPRYFATKKKVSAKTNAGKQ